MSLLQVVLTRSSVLIIITDDPPFFKGFIDNGISKAQVVQIVIAFVEYSNRVPAF